MSTTTDMKVLVVSDDQVSMDFLANQLTKCKYDVTIESEAIATKLLQNEKQKVDLIMIDANGLGMEESKLLQNVASLNIPFILVSSNLSKEFIMKGVGYGACDFISEPFRLYELQNIWRHVIARRNKLKTKKLKNPNLNPKKSITQAPNNLPVIENINNNRKTYGKRKYHTNENCDEKIKYALLHKEKKHRVVWSQDLHDKFIAVVDKIGFENAVPKKILELMSDENLTRENVASHLQKYRLSLKKSRQPAKKTTSFRGSLNPIDRQNLSEVVNNIQSIPGNSSVSHSIRPDGFFSPRVTRWGEANKVMNTNENIYSGVQMDRQTTMFPGLSPPLIEFDCVNQTYAASAPFVSDFPSNMRYFSEFHNDWTQIQSPRLSLSCPSNDSAENMPGRASGHIDAPCANGNELYDCNSRHYQFTDYNTSAIAVDHELLSDGSTFFCDDYNILRGINIDENYKVASDGMANLKLQKQVDGYVPMQPFDSCTN